MPYLKSPQCKICQSVIRNKIDKMISDPAIPSRDIRLFSAKKKLTINNVNLHRHRKHMAPARENLRKKIKDSNTPATAISNSEFLESIKNKVHELILSGDQTPSISEALKATELILKINEGDPATNAVLEFIQSVSTQKGNNGHNSNTLVKRQSTKRV